MEPQINTYMLMMTIMVIYPPATTMTTITAPTVLRAMIMMHGASYDYTYGAMMPSRSQHKPI